VDLSLCHLAARWGLCLPLWIVWQGMQGRGFCLAMDVRVGMNANGVGEWGRLNVNGVGMNVNGVEFEFEWDGVRMGSNGMGLMVGSVRCANVNGVRGRVLFEWRIYMLYM
jgi:hypothetical protein